MTDYVPIDCGLHSEYELTIMRRTTLRLCWRDADDDIHIERLIPVDLQTRNGEEFMLAISADGSELCIRLDHIIKTDNL